MNRRFAKRFKTTLCAASVNYINQSIFINENLTARRKELLAKARKLKKEKSYHRVWTMDGKIFLRIAEGTKTIQIREEDDLDKFK